MPRVHREVLLAAAGQLVLLVVLARTVGLSGPAWVAGVLCAGAIDLLLVRGSAVSGALRLGAANRVTLLRASLVAGVTALLADGWSGPGATPVLVALAALALALDGVDGWVARRTGTVSELGARFDMEVDAFVILVLSVEVARSLGVWVLLIGAARYAFVVAGWALPWLAASLPPRYWRKPVAAIQGIVLTAGVAGLPQPALVPAVLVALALLSESFGRDVWWLWRRRGAPAPVPVGDAVRPGLPSGG